jgi:tyrosyl-tRNA synthetase
VPITGITVRSRIDAELNGNVLDVLAERGFVKDATNLDGLRKLLEQPATVYWGCDATATSFHVGNQVGMMAMAWLQRFGHNPIILMGGGTTMVGDPSGKSAERPIMTRAQILNNEERLRPQFERFVTFGDGSGDAKMLDNSDWLLTLNLVEFLRDVGGKVTVNHMLGHETYRDRLEQGGLSFLEFSYQLMQGYDYLHLFREHGCRLQVGGSDQWANILAGVDLVRRSEAAEVFALVWPLLTTSSGAKMGKTASGAVWLDPTLLSPYEYYQFWINPDDADVERFLALFTFLPMDEVRELGGLKGDLIREAKERLAYEATRILHGQDAAQDARATSQALFGGRGAGSAAPTAEVARARIDVGIPLAELVVDVRLYSSKREATRKIAEGGLYVNGDVVSTPNRIIGTSDVDGDSILLRSGKKRYLRILVTG